MKNAPWLSNNLKTILLGHQSCLVLSQMKSCLPILLWPPYAVSLVLIRVDCSVQRPIYYVSKSLHETEVRYLPLEKAILAVVLGTRKLPHYFQAHTVVVLTQLPLKAILRSVDYTRRIAKWGAILRAFDIKYMPRTSVK